MTDVADKVSKVRERQVTVLADPPAGGGGELFWLASARLDGSGDRQPDRREQHHLGVRQRVDYRMS